MPNPIPVQSLYWREEERKNTDARDEEVATAVDIEKGLVTNGQAGEHGAEEGKAIVTALTEAALKLQQNVQQGVRVGVDNVQSGVRQGVDAVQHGATHVKESIRHQAKRQWAILSDKRGW